MADLDLEDRSDDELAAIASAVRAEQSRRYQRAAAPQQITAAIASAVAAGVPLEELQHTIDDALHPARDDDSGDDEDTDDVEDGADDPPSGSE